VTKRPSPSGLEVRAPVDLRAEVRGPRSEQVEAVSEDRVSPLEYALAGIELEAGDGRHRRQHRTTQRSDRVDPSEGCRDLSGPHAERPCSQPSLAKSAASEGGHAPNRGPRPRALPERQTLAKPDSQPVGMRPATQ
jgi:hypothetical protein